MRAILERKYAKVCPPEYIDKIANSVKDHPVRLREPRYVKDKRFRVEDHGPGKAKLP